MGGKTYRALVSMSPRNSIEAVLQPAAARASEQALSSPGLCPTWRRMAGQGKLGKGMEGKGEK